MCFSTAASFSASIGLGIIGSASLLKVKEPHQYAFAGIPLVFAMQQCVEGVVWLSLTKSGWEGYQSSASFLYLLIAQVIWPLWLPLAFWLFEKDEKRKKVLKLFLLPAIIIAGYFLFWLISIPREISVVNHHIFYKLDLPVKLIPFAAFLYLVSTIIPPLWSRNIYIRLMGVVLLASYIVSRIFFQPSLFSVWCFLAIGIGILVFLVIRSEKAVTIQNSQVGIV